jgi:hypothetical protein
MMTDAASIYRLLINNIFGESFRKKHNIDFKYINYNEHCNLEIKISDFVMVHQFREYNVVCKTTIISDDTQNLIKLLSREYKFQTNHMKSSNYDYINHSEQSIHNINKFNEDDTVLEYILKLSDNHIVKINKLDNNMFKYESNLSISCKIGQNFDIKFMKYAKIIADLAQLKVDTSFIANCTRILDKYSPLNIDLNNIILQYVFESYLKN